MSLFGEWKALVEKERSQKEAEAFWKAYFEKEKICYEQLLENHTEVVSGKLGEVAQKFDMDPVTFAGFVDGINTSLVHPYELDDLKEDLDIKLEIDFEKLFYNMLDAKADWLYTLPQWDGVVSEERRNEITKEFKRSQIAVSKKVGRNEPCTCGSGKKYKKCCGVNA
ncbi:MAG: SEC-C metal-binding domain-containing protein [Clostridia bacterium]|nr:SEC-C metal-binding domain-containing protein [Clostridia bacterium]